MDGNIGFLKDKCRINVALTRARKGLYCIGNFDCLVHKSELWQKLIAKLKDQKAFGNALEVYCQNHTDSKFLMKSKHDFNQAPEGGCKLQCNNKLPCGHLCKSTCHIIDKEHINRYRECREMCKKKFVN